MGSYIAQFSLLVKDYDEAIQYFTNRLKFILIEDTVINEEKRWVVISPSHESSCSILLAKAVGEDQISRIGDQTGGRVFIFLYTDDIERDQANLIKNEIKIIRPMSAQPHGKVLVFQDLYGNLWDLIEPVKETADNVK